MARQIVDSNEKLMTDKINYEFIQQISMWPS